MAVVAVKGVVGGYNVAEVSPTAVLVPEAGVRAPPREGVKKGAQLVTVTTPAMVVHESGTPIVPKNLHNPLGSFKVAGIFEQMETGHMPLLETS